jgi:DNA-binding NtrC family response regulator
MPPAPTVLVAEDQPLLRWAIGRALAAIGATVVPAASYEEASERLSNRAFAAIVVASPLDGRSVVGILSEVDRQQPHTRVLVLCAGEECESLLRNVPHATLFRKPFPLSELVAAVAPAVGLNAASAAPSVGALTTAVTPAADAQGAAESCSLAAPAGSAPVPRPAALESVSG